MGFIQDIEPKSSRKCMGNLLPGVLVQAQVCSMAACKLEKCTHSIDDKNDTYHSLVVSNMAKKVGNILITQRPVLRLTPGKRCPEATIVAAKSPFETHSRGKQLTHIRCAA